MKELGESKATANELHMALDASTVRFHCLDKNLKKWKATQTEQYKNATFHVAAGQSVLLVAIG